MYMTSGQTIQWIKIIDWHFLNDHFLSINKYTVQSSDTEHHKFLFFEINSALKRFNVYYKGKNTMVTVGSRVNGSQTYCTRASQIFSLHHRNV